MQPSETHPADVNKQELYNQGFAAQIYGWPDSWAPREEPQRSYWLQGWRDAAEFSSNYIKL